MQSILFSEATDSQNKEYTIGEWMDIWFDVYSHVDLKDSTISIYRDSYRRVCTFYPEIKTTYLSSLSSIAFQVILNTLGKQYAKSTVRHLKLLFNKAYLCAIDNNLCNRNPIKSCVVPKNAFEKTIEALTSNEQEMLEKSLCNLLPIDDFSIRFLLNTGLRRGEFLALKWDDWDKKNNVLKIRDSKTKKGIREIPLIPETTYILSFLQFREKHAKVHCDHIFTVNRKPINAFHLRHICNKASKLAKIRHFTPHMLRHTFATRLIEKGADAKTVSEILGHKNVSFTLKTYVTIDRTHKSHSMMLLSKTNLNKKNCDLIA